MFYWARGRQKIKKWLILTRALLFRFELIKIKRDQVATFYTLRKNFPDIYNKLKNYNVAQFMTPLRENFNKKLEKAFLPYPPFSFLKNRMIMNTMFVAAGGK